MPSSEYETAVEYATGLLDLSFDALKELISCLPVAAQAQLSQCNKRLHSLAFKRLTYVHATVSLQNMCWLAQWLEKYGKSLECLSVQPRAYLCCKSSLIEHGMLVSLPWKALKHLKKLTMHGLFVYKSNNAVCMQHSSEFTRLLPAYPYSSAPSSILQISNLRNLTLEGCNEAPGLLPGNINSTLTELRLTDCMMAFDDVIDEIQHIDIATALLAMPSLVQLTIDCPSAIVYGNIDRLTFQHGSLQILELSCVWHADGLPWVFPCVAQTLTCLEVGPESDWIDSTCKVYLLESLTEISGLQRLSLHATLLEDMPVDAFTAIGMLTTLTYLQVDLEPYPHSEPDSCIMTKIFQQAAGQKMFNLKTAVLNFNHHISYSALACAAYKGAADLAALASAAPNLQHLEIPSICQLMLSCDDLSSLQSLTALTGLVVKDSAWSQHEVQLLAQLRNLQLLDMSTTIVDGYGSPQDSYLVLYSVGEVAAHMSALRGLTNLTKLIIDKALADEMHVSYAADGNVVCLVGKPGMPIAQLLQQL